MTYGRSGYYHSDPLMDDAISIANARYPYYAGAIAKLRIVADTNVPTMATSAKWVTHYNPDTLRTWTPDERAAVLVHELEHLLRDHHGRCGERDPGNFNIAGDAEINQRLDNLPDGAIYPETLGMPRGGTAETYYGATNGGRKPEPETDDGDGDGKPDDGTGDGKPGDGDGTGDGAGDGTAGKPSGKSGKSGKPGKPGNGTASCGSAAGGELQSHELGDYPGPGATDDGESARREVAEAIMDANGLLPGTADGDELRQWAESELDIDRAGWYAALAATVGRTLAPYGAPTRWRWPGRRDPRDMGGAMVPRWTGERPECAVIIDTSSSITPSDLDMARAAGHFIGRMADVTYYGCDTRATNYGSRLPEHIAGGGGTYLVRGIEMAVADGAKTIVVITDCGTSWPSEPTPVPVIIGANRGAEAILRAAPGSWGENYKPPEWMVVLPIVRPDGE